MGGSVGVGVAFGRIGVALGLSGAMEGFVSCAKELCSIKKMSAPNTMNFRKSMKTKGESENLRLSSRADLQRKPPRVFAAEGAETDGANESQTRPCFPDIIRNLGSYPAQNEGMNSLRLSEVAPGAQ
jgi:hypothetical protein